MQLRVFFQNNSSQECEFRHEFGENCIAIAIFGGLWILTKAIWSSSSSRSMSINRLSYNFELSNNWCSVYMSSSCRKIVKPTYALPAIDDLLIYYPEYWIWVHPTGPWAIAFADIFWDTSITFFKKELRHKWFEFIIQTLYV